MLKPSELPGFEGRTFDEGATFLKLEGQYDFEPLTIYPFKKAFQPFWSKTQLVEVDAFTFFETGDVCKVWAYLGSFDEFMRLYDWERGGLEIWRTVEGRWWADMKRVYAVAEAQGE